jgi:hypothetical protein
VFVLFFTHIIIIGLIMCSLSMLTLSKVSRFTKAGILLMFLGLLVLGVEDIFLDESYLLTTLYLLPIGCFFSSFIAFLFAAKYT